jgi:hypothetical protein
MSQCGGVCMYMGSTEHLCLISTETDTNQLTMGATCTCKESPICLWVSMVRPWDNPLLWRWLCEAVFSSSRCMACQVPARGCQTAFNSEVTSWHVPGHLLTKPVIVRTALGDSTCYPLCKRP